MPIVDSINWDTLKHNVSPRGGIDSAGIWEWGFLYKEMRIAEGLISVKHDKTSPNK